MLRAGLDRVFVKLLTSPWLETAILDLPGAPDLVSGRVFNREVAIIGSD